MTKPDNVERWAWDESDELMRGVYVTSEWFPEDITVEKSRHILQGKIARALMEAREGNSPSDDDARKKADSLSQQELGINEAIVKEANLRNSYAGVRLKMALVHLAAADKILNGED